MVAMENKTNSLDDDKGLKSVDDRVSTGLGKTSEAGFEVIALNPDETAEEIRERYGLSTEKWVSCISELERKGFVEPVHESEDLNVVWRVTELGRLQLLKWVQVMRFDVMEAELRGQSPEVVKGLKRKRTGFENAYNQCKVLFE